MDQETRIETRMILQSERCFEAESGMRRVGIKGWVVFRSFGPHTSEPPNPPFLVTEPGEGHGTVRGQRTSTRASEAW